VLAAATAMLTRRSILLGLEPLAAHSTWGAFATLDRDGLASPTGLGLGKPGSSGATSYVCASAPNELGPSGIMLVRKTQIDMVTLYCN
jgi:hypothetical protein